MNSRKPGKETRVGIIGGGYAGLTAAYELQKAGAKVFVFEKYGIWGGQAATIPLFDTRIEIFYHHLFAGDRHIIGLMEELGISDRLRWIDSKVGFFSHGKIYNFVTPIDILTFSPLSLPNRLRLGITALYLQRLNNWKPLEKITAKEWILKHAGKAVYREVWGPLLRGKFGDMAEQVAMVWLWGKLKLRGESRKGPMAKEKLAYPMGSFQIITDALVNRLKSGGAEMYLNAEVKGIFTGKDPHKVGGVKLRGGKEIPLDAVIATLPNYAMAEISPPSIGAEFLSKLKATRYQAAIVLLMVSRKSLSHIYWLNIADREIPFVGIIEHTNYIPPKFYGGKHIIYVTNYLDKDNPLYRMSPEELFREYIPGIKKVNPDFEPDWIEKKFLFRAEAGQPVVTLGYSERIPEHRTPIEGLYLANTSQIYPEDRGTNYSVRLGQEIARMVKEDLNLTGLTVTQ